MTIFAVAFVVVASLIALVLPWIGVLAYYLFSVMQMQYLWPYEFGEGRVQVIISAATILGLAGATALKLVDWNRMLTPYSVVMTLLVINVNLSMHFSEFYVYVDPMKDLGVADVVLTQGQILSIFNKTLFFYFIASLLIDTRKKLEWSIYVLAGILLFYAFWANKVYFTGEFWRFGDNGRLGGPQYSNYIDENYLAMLYVLATPVLYYLGIARKTMFFRYAIWFFIPITWHALFLTSSRGGMFSLAVVCIYLFFRSFDRKASIGMAVALVLAVTFQSGNLLTRVDSTIAASEQLNLLPEQKLDPRLISWGIATEIMREYPLFGVGVGNFYNAFPQYSDTQPHVVHNTYLQFSANCGIGAGLIYLWLFAQRLPTLKRSADINGTRNFPRGFSRDYLDDLLNSLLLAFFMVAIFLDLMIYEILYFIIVMSFCKYNLDREDAPKNDREDAPKKHSPIDSIYRHRESFRSKATS
jgi:hypothetical protein